MTVDDAAAAASAMTSRDPRLVVVSQTPFNAELPSPEQMGVVTPTPLFYARNHFPVPQIRAEEWRLAIEGAVAHPYSLTYAALRSLPSRTLVVTLECAGNGRLGLHPPADGEPWGYGATSTDEWTGVPLHAVLRDAGLQPDAVEVVVDGADTGHVAAAGGTIRYARSLPTEWNRLGYANNAIQAIHVTVTAANTAH